MNKTKENNINEIKISDKHRELLRIGFSKDPLCWIDLRKWKITNPLGNNKTWKLYWGFLDTHLKQIKDFLKEIEIDVIYKTANQIKNGKDSLRLDEFNDHEVSALMALLNLNNVLNTSFRQIVVYNKWARYISNQPEPERGHMIFDLMPLVTSHGAKGLSILSSQLEKASSLKKYKNEKISAANKRHLVNRHLKKEAIRLYRESNFKSMKDASRKITPQIQIIACTG